MASLAKPVRILGVPLDLGAGHRGTDMGPSALRIAGVHQALEAHGCDVRRESDIHVPAMETREPRNLHARFRQEILHVCSDLHDRVRQVLAEGARPLIYGGDHSLAMGSVAGVAGHYRDLNQEIGLIWFDAHGDMNLPKTSPSGNVHGMPLAHLLGRGDKDLAMIGGFAGKVKPENVALVGIRDIDKGEREIIRESGIHAFTMRDIDERGMAAVTREALAVVNQDTAGFYLSFDVDGLDPDVAPGVGTPVPGGVDFREAHLMLEMIAENHRMVGMEVVELNPVLDNGNASAEAMKHLILSAFGLTIL
ncbi:MAG: arginase [Planctomycetes bacterium]|jgi:arginase|nr:arginase [Planctomycetota bacterium]MBT4028575.1 arginase [Planctomycetota bacterium]MBT4559467.1 arginase [Planctomycetota bacterium]MBT5101361.1 arginase [Planctomycetota bacterium]MBT7012617.1 arginase [Planctomycetota bacterium]